jgi:hypothetical protein
MLANYQIINNIHKLLTDCEQEFVLVVSQTDDWWGTATFQAKSGFHQKKEVF